MCVIFSSSREVVMYTSKYKAIPIQRRCLLYILGYIASEFSSTAYETLLDFPKINIFFYVNALNVHTVDIHALY